MEMLDPQPDERLIDPSCGTGGFLITAMNHALAHIDKRERDNWMDESKGTDEERRELYHAQDEYLRECVFGLDLNPGLVRAAKMNMVMNNDGSAGLWQANSLANPRTWTSGADKRVMLGSFDVIVANPPFGANIVIDDEEILSQYELAAMWDRGSDGQWKIRRNQDGKTVLQKNQPPEILFIERCVQLLRPGGRFALVIPNGILNNPALGYVRTWLMQNTRILAVVDMARELFQPKNDTQTSMVLAQRLTAEERSAVEEGKFLKYPIFMASTEYVGHDKRGNVLYKRNDVGDDIMVTRAERRVVIDPESGVERFVMVDVSERMVNDELADVARAYRERDWMATGR